MVYLSVIIPTYNRAEKLNICLSRLFNQSLTEDAYEVIVVDDGSSDDTTSILEKFKNERKNVSSFSQKNSGQGNARNLGLKHAKGQILIFIGDDIYPDENFLKTHADFHISHPEKNYACLGMIEWFPEQKITPFMHWLTNGGPQFAYNNLKNGEEATFWYFYTSNISLKKELMEKNKFDSDFKNYGWEDIELAYRMCIQDGLKLIFEKNALAYHDHFIEEESLKKRMLSIGKSAHIFQNKHSNLKLVPRGFKFLVLSMIGSMPVIISLHLISIVIPLLKKYYWYSLSKRYFIMGIKNV